MLPDKLHHIVNAGQATRFIHAAAVLPQQLIGNGQLCTPVPYLLSLSQPLLKVALALQLTAAVVQVVQSLNYILHRQINGAGIGVRLPYIGAGIEGTATFAIIFSI
jgi:hypothetical protein